MRKSVGTCVLVAFAHYLLLATATASADAPASVPLVRNLVTDYAAGEANKGSDAPDIAKALQRAVDDVGAAGGGTIVVPARVGGWQISRPVFVGYPNVTIAGEGAGTRISGGGTIFLLGVRQHEPQAESAGHFPLISGPGGTLDGSVKTPRYGLRTIDGRASASGYFPACPLAFGSKIPQASGTDEWKNYEAGSGQPTYWRHWPAYTINLAVRNNAADPRVHRSEYYFRNTSAVCNGGMNLLNDVHADAPAGSVYPSKAAFSMETIAYSRASLVMRDCSAANMGPSAAFVELPFVAFRSPGTLLLERCAYRGNPISAWVRTDSAWWAGQVREFDPVAPVAKYFVSNAPSFPVWGPGKKYHRNEHVRFSERGWGALDDHSADAASPPGSDAGGAHWRRAISTVVFEPVIPPQPPR